MDTKIKSFYHKFLWCLVKCRNKKNSRDVIIINKCNDTCKSRKLPYQKCIVCELCNGTSKGTLPVDLIKVQGQRYEFHYNLR